MTGTATFVRLISVVAAIVGIVNLTGIPENTDRLFGAMLLGVAVGLWVLANKMMQMAYDTVLKKAIEREALTEDEAELLRSREPTGKDYGRMKSSSVKEVSGVKAPPLTHGDGSKQDLTRDDAPRPERTPESDEGERLQFCHYLAISGGTNALPMMINLARYAQREDRCRTVAVYNLMMGVAFARKYPSKARAVLVREEEPLPLSGLDCIGWKMRNDPLAGLWHGEEELLELHQSEWSRYLQKAERGSTCYGWLLGKVYARFEPVLNEKDSLDQAMLLAALIWAIRDGIAFGLFVTNDRALKEFYQEATQINKHNFSRDARDIKQQLKSYEAQSGTIKELNTCSRINQ